MASPRTMMNRWVKVWRTTVLAFMLFPGPIGHPPVRCSKDNRREHPDNEQQHPRHSGRVPHLVVCPSLKVQVEGIEQRGVEHAATAAADDVRLGERLERGYHLHDQVEQNHRREQGYGYGEELPR